MNPNKRRIFFALSLVLLAGVLSSCLFFNRLPIAHFTASPLSGTSPLTVSFDASGSSDLDGTIVSYEWNFGDGTNATGVTPTHTFTTTATQNYTVTLTVTDDAGKTATSTQTIEVLAGGPPGNNPPTARFTVNPSYGNAPLTVTFDASLSSDVDGSIVTYSWDFGDDSTGSGKVISHTFNPVASANFTVTLTVTDDGGAQASTTAVITVFVPPSGPTEGPTASFTTTDPVTIYQSPNLPSVPSVFEVTFDPSTSTPAPGHPIQLYVWNFGDGESVTMLTDATVKHPYSSGAAVHTYVVTLTVIDDQGLTDSAVRNVTVRN